MGRTFLDIDMARAADLLGMDRRQAEAIRDLPRGTFLALGPAVSRRPITVRIGAVETSARSGSPKLVPLPDAKCGRPARSACRTGGGCARIADGVRGAAKARAGGGTDGRGQPPAAATLHRASRQGAGRRWRRSRLQVLRAIVSDGEAALRPASVLFQDYQVRCRMAGLARPPLDLPAFTRRLSCARGGVFDTGDPAWADALALAEALPEDMMGAFLLVAGAAREGAPCPSDTAIAETYGTSSLGRVRRLIGYIEARDLFVCRTDLGGKRSITIPHLGWTTAAAEAA